MNRLLASIPLILLVAILWPGTPAVATAQPLGWPCDYGYRPGNTWFYRSTSFQGVYSDRVLRDSVGANGEYWAYFESPRFSFNGWYRIGTDCTFDLFLSPSDTLFQHWFLPRADSGDWWVVDTFSARTATHARVDDIYLSKVFGKWVTSRDVVYYPADQIGETWYTSEEWGEGVGVIRKRRHPGGYDELVGAIIDGVIYGDVSSVDEPQDNTAMRLVARPLPASEAVWVDINVKGERQTRIEIYDMLGRMVHNQELTKFADGLNSILVDLSKVAPGSYLVAINLGETRYTTPLVIAR